MILTLLGVAAALATPTLSRASQSAHRTPPRDSLGAHADLYSGRAGNLRVRTPRINTHIDVDGTLDDPVWQQAAVLTGFSEYLPVDGLAAEDSTEVLVWYSHTAIYFGIRAYEPHGAVHAALANRDKIDADDNVQFILSPFSHSRQALVFAVNPFGVQEDGTITEGVTTQSAGSAVPTHGRPGPPTDLSPDFVYESKGHLTPFGYEVVVRIPFRSIKFQASSPAGLGTQHRPQGPALGSCRHLVPGEARGGLVPRSRRARSPASPVWSGVSCSTSIRS